ncbi:MAG: c-type cytochrome, partial [Bacteroidia bacterium]
RKSLESKHQNPAPGDLDIAWENLSHEDRFVRYAARVLLEQFPPAQWKDRLLAENNDQVFLEAALSAARLGSSDWKSAVYDKLAQKSMSSLPGTLHQSYIRVVALALCRWGDPEEATRPKLVSSLAPFFPSKDPMIAREALPVLIRLGDASVVEKGVNYLVEDANSATNNTALINEEIATRSEQYGPQIADMLKNMPPATAIAVAQHLSYAEAGWTPDLREKYFFWFQEAMKKSGGVNYRGFLDVIRQNALIRVPESESELLAKVSGTIKAEQSQLFANLPQPVGPGKNWDFSEAEGALWQSNDQPKDFSNGEKMFQAALCASCHTMKGKGNSVGPDLTQAGTRFSRGEILVSIMLPSDVISDQYASTMITKKDGTRVTGRIISEDASNVEINVNPYFPSQKLTIPVADITSREISQVSAMPTGLLNRLNEKEIIDLVAYIQAGGDPSNEIYTKSK